MIFYGLEEIQDVEVGLFIYDNKIVRSGRGRTRRRELFIHERKIVRSGGVAGGVVGSQNMTL